MVSDDLQEFGVPLYIQEISVGSASVFPDAGNDDVTDADFLFRQELYDLLAGVELHLERVADQSPEEIRFAAEEEIQLVGLHLTPPFGITEFPNRKGSDNHGTAPFGDEGSVGMKFSSVRH